MLEKLGFSKVNNTTYILLGDKGEVGLLIFSDYTVRYYNTDYEPLPINVSLLNAIAEKMGELEWS